MGPELAMIGPRIATVKLFIGSYRAPPSLFLCGQNRKLKNVWKRPETNSCQYGPMMLKRESRPFWQQGLSVYNVIKIGVQISHRFFVFCFQVFCFFLENLKSHLLLRIWIILWDTRGLSSPSYKFALIRLIAKGQGLKKKKKASNIIGGLKRASSKVFHERGLTTCKARFIVKVLRLQNMRNFKKKKIKKNKRGGSPTWQWISSDLRGQRDWKGWLRWGSSVRGGRELRDW